MGGDSDSYTTHAKILVSIHAPAWGATALNTRITHALGVSIHAPAWGATVSV